MHIEIAHTATDWIPLGTLLVLTLTLAVVVWYAYETNQIKKASNEQSEAQQKPCITVESTPRPFEDAVLDAPRTAQLRGPETTLINIGTGPAINLSYSFQQVDTEEGQLAIRSTGFVPHLQARERWRTATAIGILLGGNFEFVARYETLSGSVYTTEIRMERGVFVSLRFGKSS